MTWALCLNCGETKFGALCPCPACQSNSTGDISLDIQFSDHNISVETIKEFGEVVRAIQAVCTDDRLRNWSFLHYVSSNHPELLTVKLDPEFAIQVEDVLTRANPPEVTLRKPEHYTIDAQPEMESDDG